MHILVIEDEAQLCSSIAEGLRLDGYEVDTCMDGNEGLDLCLTEPFDLILLDLNLPGMDGLSILQQLRAENSSTPVIILSARTQIQDKVEGLDLGANDYLTKPFFMEELKARINAILKSMGKVKTANILEFKDLKIDMKTKKIYINDNEVELNEKLYKLLEYLVLNKGVLLFKEQIFDNICGYNSDAATEIIEVYISRLRKQLNNFGYGKYLVTKRGMGYILDESVDG